MSLWPIHNVGCLVRRGGRGERSHCDTGWLMLHRNAANLKNICVVILKYEKVFQCTVFVQKLEKLMQGFGHCSFQIVKHENVMLLFYMKN